MKIDVGDKVKIEGVPNRLRLEYAQVLNINEKFVRVMYRSGEIYDDWPRKYIMDVEKKGE